MGSSRGNNREQLVARNGGSGGCHGCAVGWKVGGAKQNSLSAKIGEKNWRASGARGRRAAIKRAIDGQGRSRLLIDGGRKKGQQNNRSPEKGGRKKGQIGGIMLDSPD